LAADNSVAVDFVGVMRWGEASNLEAITLGDQVGRAGEGGLGGGQGLGTVEAHLDVGQQQAGGVACGGGLGGGGRV
jgi:hypothetical protein